MGIKSAALTVHLGLVYAKFVASVTKLTKLTKGSLDVSNFIK